MVSIENEEARKNKEDEKTLKTEYGETNEKKNRQMERYAEQWTQVVCWICMV